MPIVLARIDQRLVHGVTVNQWNAELNPKRYMIVDNLISQDETIKASMRMSKPSGTGMSIIDEQKAITNFNNGNYDHQVVFLLVKEPKILLNLIAGGVKIPSVNVGVIFKEDGRTPITERVALNDEELADLKALQAEGIPVHFQYTPGEPAVSLNDAIKGKM
ncbi:PTS sugar transporter subunit IIB [Lacticaseibacillus zeae]|uniref:PTS sugar transporter subunit IIB n=1 Tax=Lacticaseibacillus zeae subsp. silagei TaxID=3068307 RepID=A0ABD7ZAM0_LACZE|nr:MULTISPECIES: PTS sugar transporter subunit IIB [Lacticaseibacillus]MDE3314435.1 PTS sugar transporter subunit IIB [Lacticaseibacillus zeae]OFR98967.1 PTS mannose transporter subunit IIC [Lactobacillus sp. HMSC068F07]WLV84063.1 PTS sugar transporter subunit IIB [Lacticaseibacillus sp. NCIMB 15475]WLV86818.1 PTS sugar transporter subunit IIB [Lacticaseibacillus sp. NCIMB 15474]